MSESNAVLVVCANAPYPPTSGTPLRTWQTISLAARSRRVGVLSIGARDPGINELPGVAIWRHVDVNAGENAAFGFPLLTDAASLDALEAAFLEIDELLRPRVVVFSNLWPDRVPGALRTAPRNAILDLHNVYSSYAMETGRDHDAAAQLEARAARSVDALWACSEEDARSLRAVCSPTPVAVVPNGVDLAAYADVRDGRSRSLGRTGLTLLFVGSFWYEPNRLAAEMLVSAILPEVRTAIPSARLMLVGAAPSAAMLDAANADRGITVTGRVPDVRPYLALADIVVAPLAYGSGTRLKLLEAFAAGRAVVATAKAAEGLDVRDGIELLMRDEPVAFTRALIELGEAPDRRSMLAANAYRRVAERYSWDVLAAQVDQALSC